MRGIGVTLGAVGLVVGCQDGTGSIVDEPADSGAQVGDGGGRDAGRDTGLPDGNPAVADGGAPDAGPSVDLDPCPSVFDQGILPEYQVEISDAEWLALMDEFLNREARDAAGLPLTPYHPIGFRYQGGEPVANTMIRLKGESSWRLAVELDPNPKMQFVISFNEIDRHARFAGLRKIELDMPRNDWSFLRQRLALSYLRDVGIEAPCANNARLVINGSYYGLFTAIERMDKEFLQRYFGDNDEGDLWESGSEIKNNEDSFDYVRIDALNAVTSVAELAAIADLPAALREWAAEAVLPDADGYYGGARNFYLYDHPTRGFVWLPHDKDATLDYGSPDMSPVLWERDLQPGQHYLLVMNDPASLEEYVLALAWARAGYHVDELERRVDSWSAQIAGAAESDMMKPFSNEDHEDGVVWLHDAPAQRAEFIDAWLQCRASGGPDADDDGFDACHDCDDGDDSARPGAVEVCNLLDDDCDGRIESPGEWPCPPLAETAP